MGNFLRLAWLMILIFLIAIAIGCNKGSEGEPPPPVGPLIIIADAEGDGVIVTWHQVSDVDGYHVVTPDGDTVSLDYDETSYNDDFPSSTGTYIVFAVRGSINGETSQISTAPYASPAPETLYVFSHPTKPCSFGWDAVTGIGSTSIADFYLND